jgi:hypothetical protein
MLHRFPNLLCLGDRKSDTFPPSAEEPRGPVAAPLMAWAPGPLSWSPRSCLLGLAQRLRSAVELPSPHQSGDRTVCKISIRVAGSIRKKGKLGALGTQLAYQPTAFHMICRTDCCLDTQDCTLHNASRRTSCFENSPISSDWSDQTRISRFYRYIRTSTYYPYRECQPTPNRLQRNLRSETGD